jgi:exonuclease III
MDSAESTVINWNIAWKTERSRAGREILRLLRDRAPDLLCLPESYVGLLPDYHGAFSASNYGYPEHEGRRKVALWSSNPWREISDELPNAPPGRFVSGVTSSSAIPALRVIGVCVPWEAAHVSTGRRDRRRWDDHIDYLVALNDYLENVATDMPTLVIGDINQTLPPRRAPERARELLERLASNFTVVDKANREIRSVCHMFLNHGLTGDPLEDLPKTIGTITLSDHFGHLSAIRRISPSH